MIQFTNVDPGKGVTEVVVSCNAVNEKGADIKYFKIIIKGTINLIIMN